MEKNTGNQLGFYVAILTTILTVITFGIAIFTPPLSGPFCEEGCFEYPFTNIVAHFPRDYLWMYPAMLWALTMVVLMVCIYHFASEEKKVFAHLGLAFAMISATILIIDYFIQISVIQPSLLNGETAGIAILTQYNPHGIFIALEEAGYLMMSLAFFSAAPVFSIKDTLKKTIRLTYIISFLLSIFMLVIFSWVYGIHREYRFEVVVISIIWIASIISGILLSILFRRVHNY